MKTVLISQRLSKNKYGSYEDSLEHAYIEYFTDKGFFVLSVPNTSTSSLKRRIQEASLIVLSGGGKADLYDKRGMVESYLIREALKKQIPILGICRGMQFLNLYFGGTIKRVKGHIGNHEIMVTSLFSKGEREGVVNSYHDYGIYSENLASSLDFFALSEDGVIEGIYHKHEKIIGVQWHPERKSEDGKYYSKWLDEFIFGYLELGD